MKNILLLVLIILVLFIMLNSYDGMCCSEGIYGTTSSPDCIPSLAQEYSNYDVSPYPTNIVSGSFSAHSEYAFNYIFWYQVWTLHQYYSDINSGYRCPVINVLKGGMKSSYHQYGSAADLQNPTDWLKENAPQIFPNEVDYHSATMLHVGYEEH